MYNDLPARLHKIEEANSNQTDKIFPEATENGMQHFPRKEI